MGDTGMSYNLMELLALARDLDQKEHAEKEKEKTGYLRAGSSGIMSAEGDIAGQCHRRAHLRQLSLEIDPPDSATRIMFELGYANEEVVYRNLRKVLGEGTTILREEECPIQWTTSNGTMVTGRPDILVKGENGQLGLELKSVHSVWVARDAVFSGIPKLDNVIQAAHYSWKLDVPYKLHYRQYSQQSMPKFGFQAPEEGSPNSEFIAYNPKGGAKHVKQFDVVYDIRIDKEQGGAVYYKKEQDEGWIRSLVTTSDIERFFEYVSEMGSRKELGPPFINIDILGRSKGFNHEEYCVACRLASEAKGDYSKWLDMAIAMSNGTLK